MGYRDEGMGRWMDVRRRKGQWMDVRRRNGQWMDGIDEGPQRRIQGMIPWAHVPVINLAEIETLRINMNPGNNANDMLAL
jgi:hypothetical protein